MCRVSLVVLALQPTRLILGLPAPPAVAAVCAAHAPFVRVDLFRRGGVSLTDAPAREINPHALPAATDIPHLSLIHGVPLHPFVH